MLDDVLKPRPGNTEPFGQETQFAKRPVRIDEVKVLVKNSNAAWQNVERSALRRGPDRQSRVRLDRRSRALSRAG